MGLFIRKSSKPKGGSSGSGAWAVNALNRNGNGEVQGYQASQKKRDFSKSLPPNQESTSVGVDDGTVTTFSTMSNSVSDKYTSDNHVHAGKSDDGVATSRDVTFHKVRLLELQLQQRDTTISQLRLSMKASEKSQSERIDSLERQVERLIEISSGNSALIQTMAKSEEAQSDRVAKLEQRLDRLEPPSNDRAGRRGRATTARPPIDPAGAEDPDPRRDGARGIDTAALRELLAQVVAKKDGLASERDGLKWMSYSSGLNDVGGNTPSSIEELDHMIVDLEAMITQEHKAKRGQAIDPIDFDPIDFHDRRQDHHLQSNDEWCQKQYPDDDYHHIHQDSEEEEHQTKRGRDIDGRQQDPDHFNDELDEWWQGQCPSDDRPHVIQQESNENESTPQVLPEDQHSVLYKMTCRDCPEDQLDANYVGHLSTAVDNTTEALTEIVSHHFSQVWEMVQEQQDNGDISFDIQNGGVDDGTFPSSSLARILVTDHCRDFPHEEDILQWCAVNIKVEIREDDDDQISSPEIKKKRKKKHKKRREHRGDKHKKRRESRRENIIDP